ncbi:P-loop containing nucleoside triphosphate hydrolase protein [Fragilariopsis cylindrus CCMP1102]|uniref:p-loop containing nucleoside triphosphate hydrolase protein n=1 Tax=Fragilariopsis cylindrus CCMP1102 TaxID=635003 RepID=A0A1E7FGT9_9STRA|nr:P-loop containing nucleoside triphosphate hydrolase protein [Fragilariopsis cylindrus CCMP1102]|eukprot:OEU17389.1 P-loop containing nucleoside triphosphate hydrolase protein [Fragilariopsis cylindrus CCMP1102]
MCTSTAETLKGRNKVNKVENKVGVSFEGLTYSVKVKNTGKKNVDDEKSPSTLTILNDLNGSFEPEKLTMIMGPSGSGKSTLLDTLAGRKNSGILEGKIFFNGNPPTQDDYRFTVGYVEQFDTLVGELTVEQMLLYTAELKLSVKTTSEERVARVAEMIKMLNLESCRNTVIGSPLSRGISGGQAKRVNIGLALITRPPVLFLDEPTSGLDSRTANEVIELLHRLAKNQGTTIVATIHSPTGYAFSQFDGLYMIHSGETIYEGPVDKAQTYFEHHGFARDPDASLPEWFSDLYKSSEMSQLAAQSRKSITEILKEGPIVNQKKLRQPPSEFRKLFTLLKFRMVAHYKDVEFVATRFAEKFLYAVVLLTLYFGLGEKTDTESIAAVTSLLFLNVALAGFGASAFVPALNIERKLFYRELDDGCYKPITYYCSKFIEEAFIAIFSSLLFSLLVFYGVKLTGHFGIFFLIQYLTTLIGVILAYAVSAAVPSIDVACSILPLYVTICLFFGGYFIPFSKIPVGWVWYSWTSFMRYAFGAFMIDNYRDTTVGEMPIFVDAIDGTPKTVLEFYGLENGPIMNSLGACIAFLTGLLIFFATMGILALVYIRHEKR